MTRLTKDHAKKSVEVYGQLLQERAVISEITSEEVRGQMNYSFVVYDEKYPYDLECSGVHELALVLTSMWSAYDKAKSELGLGVMSSSI